MSSKWQQQSFRQRSPKSRKKKQVTLRCILCQALNKQTTLLWSGKAHWHLTSFTGFTALHACTDYKPPKICIIFFPFLYLFFLETVTQITWAEEGLVLVWGYSHSSFKPDSKKIGAQELGQVKLSKIRKFSSQAAGLQCYLFTDITPQKQQCKVISTELFCPLLLFG